WRAKLRRGRSRARGHGRVNPPGWNSAAMAHALALELGDTLAVMLYGLGGEHAAVLILEVASQLLSDLACGGDHQVQCLLRMPRTWQPHEEADGPHVTGFQRIRIKSAGLERIGHGEQDIAITGHVLVAMENVHVAETQTTLHDALQQRCPLEALLAARDHMNDQHFV